MTLNDHDLDRFLHAATTAAYRAGAHVMKYYGRDLTVDTKGAVNLAGDVVTIADRESEAIILDVLGDLHPDVAVLAEESGEDHARFEKPYFWCVDPLDGTLPFLERVNGFAVAIALVSRAGEAVMGVCYLPAFGDLYHAVAGKGAFKNGKPVSIAPSMGAGVTTLSLNHMEPIPPDRHAQVTAIAERIKSTEGVRRLVHHMHSGAVPKGCWVIDAAPALYVGVPRVGEGVSVWDLAATSCVVAEAGGVACDVFGDPLDLNHRENTYCHHKGYILASHRALADAAIAGFRRATGRE